MTRSHAPSWELCSSQDGAIKKPRDASNSRGHGPQLKPSVFQCMPSEDVIKMLERYWIPLKKGCNYRLFMVP